MLGKVDMKDPLAALAVIAATGTMLSCSARIPDNDRPEDFGSSAGSGRELHGGTLYPIRYGYRGGPYTSFGKPRLKNNPAPGQPEN